MAHEMEIYDATKEKRIEKLRIKIVVGYESCVKYETSRLIGM